MARIAAATVSRAGDADDVAAFHALGGVRVVLYLDAELEDSEEDAGKKAAAAVAESALTSRVMRLLAAGARVLVARCHRSAAEDADDDSKDEDADDGPADSCGGAGVTYVAVRSSEDEPRRRRGGDVEIPWRRAAATPRPRRG